jgi:hypothetical protein
VLQAFESLAKDNAGVFETVGASREDVLTKVRLMALLGLGAEATTLTFENVQVRCPFASSDPMSFPWWQQLH